MTRQEHIEWCKKRAKEEFNFYSRQGTTIAVRNGIASIMSDINKHPETKSDALQALCLMMIAQIHSKSEFEKFIDGFN